MGIAKDLKRAFEENGHERAPLPWWMGLQTIERALAIKDEIEGQVASFKEENRAFERALTRLGFAGHGERGGRRRPPRSS